MVPIVLAALAAHAVPLEITHQARLLDTAGGPIHGEVTLEVTLWDAETGGTNLYTLTTTTRAEDGYVSVVLTPDDTALLGTPWVQVAVDGVPLLPRTPLGASPYARIARSVDGGTVNATSVSINGSVVIDSAGQWVGSPTGLAGACYTRWGEWGCAAGYTEVVRGRPGGIENYGNGGANLFSHVECVDANATALQSWGTGGGFYNRLMRGDAQGDGMSKVPSRCSVCCMSGCYTAWGTTSCAAGWTQVDSGRVGGVEQYTASRPGVKNLCVSGSATAYYTWASGYATRLMRHRETSGGGDNGMDRIDNVCATCCRN